MQRGHRRRTALHVGWNPDASFLEVLCGHAAPVGVVGDAVVLDDNLVGVLRADGAGEERQGTKRGGKQSCFH